MTNAAAQDRSDRLKAALRENLQRRKAQVRARIAPRTDRDAADRPPEGDLEDKSRMG